MLALQAAREEGGWGGQREEGERPGATHSWARSWTCAAGHPTGRREETQTKNNERSTHAPAHFHFGAGGRAANVQRQPGALGQGGQAQVGQRVACTERGLHAGAG